MKPGKPDDHHHHELVDALDALGATERAVRAEADDLAPLASEAQLAATLRAALYAQGRARRLYRVAGLTVGALAAAALLLWLRPQPAPEPDPQGQLLGPTEPGVMQPQGTVATVGTFSWDYPTGGDACFRIRVLDADGARLLHATGKLTGNTWTPPAELVAGWRDFVWELYRELPGQEPELLDSKTVHLSR